MGKFLESGIGQFIKGALFSGLASVYPLLGTSNVTLKILGVAFIGGVIEYLHNLLPKAQ